MFIQRSFIVFCTGREQKTRRATIEWEGKGELSQPHTCMQVLDCLLAGPAGYAVLCRSAQLLAIFCWASGQACTYTHASTPTHMHIHAQGTHTTPSGGQNIHFPLSSPRLCQRRISSAIESGKLRCSTRDQKKTSDYCWLVNK